MSSTKTTKREHTHEPWLLEGTDLRATPEAMSRGFPDFIAEFEDPDDAARARACVNALAGVPDPERAVGALKKRLTSAVSFLRLSPERSLGADPEDGHYYRDEMVANLESALALLGATTP